MIRSIHVCTHETIDFKTMTVFPDLRSAGAALIGHPGGGNLEAPGPPVIQSRRATNSHGVFVMKYSLGDRRVKTQGDRYWIAPTAVVVGDVTLGRDVSIWWNAVVRADTDPIVIGDNTNIQDGSVLHADPGCPLKIGGNVTVGHMAMIHGCTVGDGCLIGIGSILLNGARIGENSVVGAGTLITEGKEFPPNSLIIGSPGVVKRTLTPGQIAGFAKAAVHYVENGRRFKELCRPD